MRPLIMSACCLLLLPLGCDSSEQDPEAAARAAQSAAGGLKHASPLPSTKGPIVDPDEGHELPTVPDKIKPPPAVGTATCVVTDGDDGDGHDPGNGQKGPGKFVPKGPIAVPDPGAPKVQGAVPKSAGTQSTSKIKANAKSAGPKGTQGVARSADGAASPISATTTKQKRSLINWGSICDSRMDSNACEELCESNGQTWDRSAGTHGTCFEVTQGTAAGSEASSVQCGCMCLPGS